MIRNTLIGSLFLVLGFPVVCLASTVTFVPQENEVGLHTPFLLAVHISAGVPINVIDLSIDFPDGMRPVDVSDGNSVVSMWIQKPSYDESTHTLTLTGFIPGGFVGQDGTVATVRVAADKAGSYTIALNRAASHIYLNDPPARDDTIAGGTVSLRASATKSNISNEIPDAFPPEEFTPQVAQMPTDTGVAWMLIFNTQDKGSGIDHYEVREMDPLMPFGSVWKTAQSPYLLQDQTLGSRVEVRAIDKNGNVRVEVLESERVVSRLFTYKVFGTEVLALILVMILAVAVWRKINGTR